MGHLGLSLCFNPFSALTSSTPILRGIVGHKIFVVSKPCPSYLVSIPDLIRAVIAYSIFVLPASKTRPGPRVTWGWHTKLAWAI